MAQLPPQRAVDDANYLFAYRDPNMNGIANPPPQYTPQSLAAARNLPPNAPPLPPPPVPGFPPFGPPGSPRGPPGPNRAARNWFASNIPELTREAATQGLAGTWRGTRFLGQGSYGKVGLWEYQSAGPGDNGPNAFRQVVVKEMTGDQPNWAFAREEALTANLMQTGSRHIVSLAFPSEPIDSVRDGEDAMWHGFIKRLVMEYCPLGDLSNLIDRFETM